MNVIDDLINIFMNIIYIYIIINDLKNMIIIDTKIY